MNWVFHDSYATEASAKKYGEEIVFIGLAKGVKIVNLGKKSKPYLLYILPCKRKERK